MIILSYIYVGTTKKQSNSTSMPQRSKGVRQKSAATTQAATAQAATAQVATAQAATQESISKKVKFSEQPTTNGVENEEEEEEEVEEEYEVECICAHQWVSSCLFNQSVHVIHIAVIVLEPFTNLIFCANGTHNVTVCSGANL